jgi:hypothetical protein
MRYFNFPLEKSVETMANKDFRIGDNKNFATVLVSSWSNNVASWTSETEFPVHVVRYEDMEADAGKELSEVLEFLGQDVDPDRVRSAVAATQIAHLREKESADGFRENSGGSEFFGKGTCWRDELGSKWIKRIESDHATVMKSMEYV